MKRQQNQPRLCKAGFAAGCTVDWDHCRYTCFLSPSPPQRPHIPTPFCTWASVLHEHTSSAPDRLPWVPPLSSYRHTVSMTESGESSNSLDEGHMAQMLPYPCSCPRPIFPHLGHAPSCIPLSLSSHNYHIALPWPRGPLAAVAAETIIASPSPL